MLNLPGDLPGAPQVHDQLAEAIMSGAPLIVADLSATVCCDTAGGNWLSIMGYHAVSRGGRLRLVYARIGEACEPLAPQGPHTSHRQS